MRPTREVGGIRFHLDEREEVASCFPRTPRRWPPWQGGREPLCGAGYFVTYFSALWWKYQCVCDKIRLCGVNPGLLQRGTEVQKNGFEYCPEHPSGIRGLPLAGRLLIPVLRRLKAGRPSRRSVPTWHMTKQGDPTMGGLMFIIAIAVVLVVIGWKDLMAGRLGGL